MARLELVGTHLTNDRTKDALRGLFGSDGIVYILTGFLTDPAYRELRDDVLSFPSRSSDNELVLVAGSGANQLSASIGRGLRRLAADSAGDVRIYTYPRGFLHAKLYARWDPSLWSC